MNSVLDTPGIPVTGTPSISLVFYFIHSRWAIYKSTSCIIDRWQAIYKCLLSFDLHMHAMPQISDHNTMVGGIHLGHQKFKIDKSDLGEISATISNDIQFRNWRRIWSPAENAW